jgi:nucleotide-binding universal stress UspA family protein
VGRIVVGMEGSDGARAALRWSLQEAHLRGCTVEVVTAYTQSAVPLYPELGYVSPEPTRLVDEITRMQEQVITDELERTQTAIEVTRSILEGRPASTLVRASEGADLLVVGSRGRGGFRGLALGSVSHQLAQHSACPVVIVRADEHW